MTVLLTDEEIYYGLNKVDPGFSQKEREEWIKRAQLKKVVEWLKKHSKYINHWDCYNDVAIGEFRGIKLEDWQTLLKEVDK